MFLGFHRIGFGLSSECSFLGLACGPLLTLKGSEVGALGLYRGCRGALFKGPYKGTITLNPKPSTLNPQPSTLNPKPTTHNPKP